MVSIRRTQGAAPQERSYFPNTVPVPSRVELEQGSRQILQQAFVGNSLCGAVHVKTGDIYLYPLANDPRYRVEEPDTKNGDTFQPFLSNEEGYGNADYNKAVKYHPTIKNVKTKTVDIIPIKHVDVDEGGAVSHEQLLRCLSGRLGEYLGFTLWVGDGTNHELIATSRALNSEVFWGRSGQNGRMTEEWARAIATALNVPSNGYRRRAASAP